MRHLLRRTQSAFYKSLLIIKNDPVDPDYYLATNKDVAAMGISPYLHYWQYGRKEGRLPRISAPRNGDKGSRSNFGLRRSNRKIALFISGEPQTPGHKYRITNIADALDQEIYESKVLSIQELDQPGVIRELEFLKDRIDFIWIWRAPSNSNLSSLINEMKDQGIPVIFDLDDLMIRPDLATAEIIDGIRSLKFDPKVIADHYIKIRETAELADLFISPTRYLTTEMMGLGKPGAILSNGYEIEGALRAADLYTEKSMQVPSEKVRIGYASGSFTHQKDFGIVADVISRILEENPNVILATYRNAINLDEFPSLLPFNSRIEWRDMVPVDRIYEEYARFDINIAPLEPNNPFTESKSNLKYFEAALVGVPTVASATEAFSHYIVNGVNGYICESAEDWHTALSRLVKDSDLRKKIGETARNAALIEFGPLSRKRALTEIVDFARKSLAKSVDSHSIVDFRFRYLDPNHSDYKYKNLYRVVNRKTPEVTVLISLYNYQEFIIEALDSVRSQTLSEIDLIIIDDCSSDDSAQVAKDWLETNNDRFCQAWLASNIKNQGLPAVRNLGFSLTRTPYIFVLDADNLLLPSCLEKLLDKAQATNAAVAYSTIKQFGDSENLMSSDEWSVDGLSAGNYIDAMALINKEAWGQAGGYYAETRGWEDYDLWCSFVDLGYRGEHVKEVLAKYRVHGKSMLRTITNELEVTTSLMELINKRHPWARPRIPTHLANELANSSIDSPAVKYKLTRLTEILEILRSPGDLQELILAEGNISTRDHAKKFPVVNGCPVLTESTKESVLMPEDHLSHGLPENIKDEIDATEGWILHLSAGTGHEFNPKVIEVEYDIYKSTDVSADAHKLPFADSSFSLVVCMNAFEHYENPFKVAQEIKRVLKPGGRVILQTAFLQPVHEAPRHFFNATKYGIRSWFSDFEEVQISVSPNFSPSYALAWISYELLTEMAQEFDKSELSELKELTVAELASWWESQESREGDPRWDLISRLSQQAQERFSAGFEAWFDKPK